MYFSGSMVPLVTAVCLIFQASAAPIGPSTRVIPRQLLDSSPQLQGTAGRAPPSHQRPGQQEDNAGLLPLSGVSPASAPQPPSHAPSGKHSSEAGPPSEGDPVSPFQLVSTGVSVVGSVPKSASSVYYGIPIGEANDAFGSGSQDASKVPPNTEAQAEADSMTVADDTGVQKDATKSTNTAEKDVPADATAVKNTVEQNTVNQKPPVAPVGYTPSNLNAPGAGYNHFETEKPAPIAREFLMGRF